MDGRITLYGMRASLYTGKVRAYLRRNFIPVVERGSGHPDFARTIVPQVGRFIMPVVVMPDGTVVQDGTDILDYLQDQGLGREPLYPENAVLKAVSLLFELFGNEGLLRPAMHYRWNFDEQNLAFIRHAFDDVLPAGMSAEQRSVMFDHASGRMRKAGRMFGVSDETAQAIERSYADFLARFDAHLTHTPFLLGDRPTIGDYGLLNPLYAHLARDPVPGDIMRRNAPRVFRWTERMNSPETNEEHNQQTPNGLFARDALPDTLHVLMSYVAEEYLTEITAHVAFINAWLIDPESDLESFPRSIGMAAFDWRGQRITSAVMPYRLYLLQRLTDHVAQASPDDRAAIEALFDHTGLGPLLGLRADRRIERRNHQEVWADH